MRQGNNSKRSRGGRSNNRKGPHGNRSIESHSPGGGKHRGNANQLYERYSNMARDAQTSGDRVACEGYLQYAEHYLRVLNAVQESRSNSNGRASGKPEDSRPGDRQQAVQNGKGGNGESQPEQTFGDSGGPLPEILKTPPAEITGDTDQSLDDNDKDPVETNTTVN